MSSPQWGGFFQVLNQLSINNPSRPYPSPHDSVPPVGQQYCKHALSSYLQVHTRIPQLQKPRGTPKSVDPNRCHETVDQEVVANVLFYSLRTSKWGLYRGGGVEVVCGCRCHTRLIYFNRKPEDLFSWRQHGNREWYVEIIGLYYLAGDVGV